MASARDFRSALGFAASAMAAPSAMSGSAAGAKRLETISSGGIDMALPGLDIADADAQGSPQGDYQERRGERADLAPVHRRRLSATHGPEGQTRQPPTGNGGDGDDYGSGSTDCGGTFTIFDDGAAVPITARAAPLTALHPRDSPCGPQRRQDEGKLAPARDRRRRRNRWHAALLGIEGQVQDAVTLARNPRVLRLSGVRIEGEPRFRRRATSAFGPAASTALQCKASIDCDIRRGRCLKRTWR